MTPTIRKLRICLLLTPWVLSACAMMGPAPELPTAHPEEVDPPAPMCTECHDPDDGPVVYQRFEHTPTFSAGAHQQVAVRQEAVCDLCHRTSFCNECHVTGFELKPSIANPGGTYRVYPHRGDYITRHQIDGRVNPTPCFRCHGNPKSSQTCTPCHGR